jgi:hypothetical protein
LFNHIRMVILSQSMINPDVTLTYDDYRGIEKLCEIGNAPELRLVCCSVRLSKTASQARLLRNHGRGTGAVMSQTQRLDRELRHFLEVFRDQLYSFDPSQSSAGNAIAIHGIYQMNYSAAVNLYGILLCLRRALDIHDGAVNDDSHRLCNDALRLAREARVYRPLGSLWVTPMLMVLWCATRDQTTRHEIEDMIRDYRRTQSMENVMLVPKKDLEWMERRLKFVDTEAL